MDRKRLSPFSKLLTRFAASIILPLIIFSLFSLRPHTALAASGGRIGGGSFRSPSIPRSSGGGYGGGSYRGGDRGGYGGGMGFPFILPIFGFGGGGLFGFLILMSIAGVLVNAVRGTNTSTITRSSDFPERKEGPITLIQLQLGLLASAKDIQKDLRKIAASADTSNSRGLQHVLQEASLSILRNPELWVYSNLEVGNVPFNSAETTFNRLTMIERSKLKAELTSNAYGQKNSDSISSEQLPGEADSINEFIAVTLIIASRSKLNFREANTSEQLQESLRLLGSISENELMALEIIWQPEGEGDVLSAEELVTAYPNLKHL